MLKYPAIMLMLILAIGGVSYAQNTNRPVDAAARPAGLPTPAPQLSVIKGCVYYEDTGRPVKRTNVMLINAPGSEGGGELSGMTDGEGNFVIKKARAGIYYAVINAPGVVTPISYLNITKLGPPRGDNVSDEKEEFERTFMRFDKIVVDGLSEVYVQIPAKHGAAISGRVMYGNGDPAVGVKIEVMRKVDGKFSIVIPNF